MEVCNVSENNIQMEDGLFVNESDEYLSIVSSKSRNRLNHDAERRRMDQLRRDQMLNSITDVCHSPFEVPSRSAIDEDHSGTKSVCKDYSGSSDKVFEVPVTLNGVKDSLLLNELNNVTDISGSHIGSVVCEDSDLQCDFLTSVSENAEKVLFELTESCDLSSNEHIPCVDQCERTTIPENNIYCSGTNSISVLGTNVMNGVTDVLSVTNETIILHDEKVSNINESKIFDQKKEFLEKSIKNEDSKSLDSYGESQFVTRNNGDSDTVSAYEKKEKGNKLKIIYSSENTLREIPMSGNKRFHNQLSCSPNTLPLSKENLWSPALSGPVVYKCINCNFSDYHLEKLTSHMFVCGRKRKWDENLESLCYGELPVKTHVLSENEHFIPSKCKLSIVSKVEPIILPQSEVSLEKHLVSPKSKISVVPKGEHVILPPTQLPQVQQAVMPKLRPSDVSKVEKLDLSQSLVSHVPPESVFSEVCKVEPCVLPQSQMPRIEQCVSLNPEFYNAPNIDPLMLPQDHMPVTSKAQFIFSPQTQLVTSSKGQHAAALKTQVVNAPQTQFVASPQAQLTGATNTVYAVTPNSHLTSTSKPQLIINPQSQLSVASKPQIIVSAQQNSALKPQITLTPEAKLMPKVQPVITLQTQLPSSSKSEVVTASKSQFSLASGTKLTLGPHSPVPIVPQTPLTISPQGLTISQEGTQLLITTKLQPNTGSPNQPTLLGLGIGTNPSVAPKNIVLLPNLLFNSVSSSHANVNGEQTPAMIQGQFILQTPTSVSSVQLQQNIVYTPQTFTSQPQVLLPPMYTVSNNSVTTSAPRTTTTSNVVQPKSAVTVSPSKLLLKATSSSTSAKNQTPDEQQPGQSTSVLDKFICEICDDYVKDLDKLRSHMKCLHAINIHPKMMPSFNCRKCQFCFFTEQGLERHLVGSHGLVTSGMQEAADKGKDGGRCPICGWGYQSKLLHHVATEHKVCLKPADLSYKCTLCTATFGVYKQFEEHVYKSHRPAMSKLAQGKPESSSSAIK